MTQATFEDRALVEAWLKEPTWLEPVDERRVAALVSHTPQVRRWLPQADLGRFAPMLNATKLVAASVILALVGGLLFTSLPTEPAVELVPAAEIAQATATPTPEATSAPEIDPSVPTITLPDELPEGSQRGTIATPAGPLDWVRLPASDEIPRISGVAPWGEGLAVWEDGAGLFATKDGIEWETLVATPRPRGAESLGWMLADQRWGHVDGMHVVLDSSGDRVLIGDDETGMRDIDSSAVSGARMDGWTQRGRWLGSGPMLVDGRVVFTLAIDYRLPYKRLGIPMSVGRNGGRMKPLGNGRYALCGSGGGPGSCKETSDDAEWVVRFNEMPEGLAVINDRSGERIGLLEGASPDDIYEGWQGQRHRIFAIEGDTVVEIDSPWPELSPREVGRRIVAPGGSTPVLAYWDGDSDGPSTTQGLPAFASELPEGDRVFRVTAFPDRLQADTPRRLDGSARAWVSADGIEWVSAPAGMPDGAVPRWVGSGWLAYDDEPGPTRFWIHLGGDWIALDAAGLPWVFGAAGYGDVTFVTGGGPRGRAVTLWVLTHPASE